MPVGRSWASAIVKRQAQVGGQTHVPPLAIDFPVGVEMLELVGQLAWALAGPEEENPSGLQTKVEQRHRLLLGQRLEIDHQVAATDQVQLGEGGVLDDVVRGEDHHLPQFLRDLVAIALAEEVPGDPLGADVGQSRLAIDARTGKLQRCPMDVGGEDLDLHAAMHGLDPFQQEDCQRVGLFARRAARHPGPELPVGRDRGQDRGEDLDFQPLECLVIAEKPGYTDQQVLIEKVQFVGILLQPLCVVVEVERLIQEEPPLGAAGDRVWLVMTEIDPIAVAEKAINRFHRRFADRIGDRRPVGAFGRRMVNAAQQGSGHFADGKHKIGNARFHRTLGHAVELGGFGTLDQDQPTGVMDGADPARTVAPRARQNNSDGPLPDVLGQGAEEVVDGERQGLTGIFVSQQQLAAGDDHLLLGRNEIDGVRLHSHTVLDAADRDGRPPCQQFVHEAAEVRREVLNDDKGEPRLGGHLLEELF